MLKYIWREKKNFIIIVSVLLICSIAIALAIYAQVTNAKLTETKVEKQEKNYTELKNNFKSIFTNSINRSSNAKTTLSDNELINISYTIEEKDSGKYDLNITIPTIGIDTPVTKKINTEIINTFAKKVVNIVTENQSNTIYTINYVAYINDNILSLVIRATLKEGSSAQRIIIQTYNYDLENNKLLKLDDILEYKNLTSDKVQSEINTKIKEISDQTSNIETQGYNIYKRNINSSEYLISNTDTFFLGQDGTLYIVYAYGNNNNTSEIDLILF